MSVNLVIILKYSELVQRMMSEFGIQRLGKNYSEYMFLTLNAIVLIL
jgi:hypothetical protein